MTRERAKVLLWTDYVSPYAFVAKAWAYELEADYEIDLEWRPYTLDIASFQGSVEQRDPHHWRRVRYAYMDARRFANKHGVFRAYNDLAFDRFWRRDLDPESVDAVRGALEEAGAPPGFADFLAGEGGARHDALRIEAEASGIFGVPSFVLDGEIFWGGDRVFLLRERLDEKAVPRRG